MDCISRTLALAKPGRKMAVMNSKMQSNPVIHTFDVRRWAHRSFNDIIQNAFTLILKMLV